MMEGSSSRSANTAAQLAHQRAAVLASQLKFLLAFTSILFAFLSLPSTSTQPTHIEQFPFLKSKCAVALWLACAMQLLTCEARARPLKLQQGPAKDRRFLMRITRCKVNRALYGGQRVQEDPPIGQVLQRY